MATHSIAVIPGDGIGVDVIAEGLKVLQAIESVSDLSLAFTEFGWGSNYYLTHREMMPSDALESLRCFDAILFGAVGHPEIPDHVTLQGLLLPIRREFDQYVCHRPNILYPGVTSPLHGKREGEIDIVVVRENTEGEYAPIGGSLYTNTSEEIVIQSNLFTRKGVERIIRYAFDLASQRDRKKMVTSVTKSNAMRHSMVFWDNIFELVAADYPDIQTSSLLVDAACMDLVRRPESFDVIVASNLFGDILSDIAAVVTGSMGLAPSGNIDPEKRYPSMFEPVHGSAPDIAGKGIANPMATILSAAMMLNHLDEPAAANSIEEAVTGLLRDGGLVTPDLGGTATTAQVGDAIVKALIGPWDA